jgi:hypothetical protein
MNKLLAKIAIVLSLLCFGNSFAQVVAYSLKDGDNRPLGQMTINYKQNGYEATMSDQKLALETTGSTTTVTMGKLIITMSVDGSYYHNRVGFWRTTPVTTSFGDKGSARMYYAGMRPGGRLYLEELWLNGKIFSRSETLIDHNDQIVWSVATDSVGTLRLDRQ